MMQSYLNKDRHSKLLAILAGLARIRQALFLVLLLILVNSDSAYATKVLSLSIYNGMNAVQKDLEKEKYHQALEKLNALLERKAKLKTYDRAKILEMLAVVYGALENYAQAIDAAEDALKLEAIEDASTNQLRYRLFHLYLFQEHYPNALRHLEIWFQSEPEPNVQSYFTAAQIYAVTEQMGKALSYALNGMALLHSKPEYKPRETWFQLLISIHLSLKNYQQAGEALEQAISLWPQHLNHYLQLSAVYQELNRGRDSFAVLSIAYKNKLLDKEFDISRLTRLYRYHDYPYKGAIIFNREVQQNRIKKTEKNLERMAKAWLQAREWSQAENALQMAAKLSDAGTHWLRLCQTSFQNENWIKTQKRCQNAIAKGGLEKEESSAWYLLALARYYEDKLSAANKAFTKCKSWEATKNECERWNLHIATILQDREIEAERLRKEAQNKETKKQEREEGIGKILQLKGKSI